MEMNLKKYQEEVEFLKNITEKQFEVFLETFDLNVGEKYKMKVYRDGGYTEDTILTIPFLGNLTEDFYFILYFPYQMDGGRGAPEYTNQFVGLKYFIEELENGNISFVKFKKIGN